MTKRDEPIGPMTLGNMRQNGLRGLFSPWPMGRVRAAMEEGQNSVPQAAFECPSARVGIWR